MESTGQCQYVNDGRLFDFLEQSIDKDTLPGLNKYANITLKWGITDSHELCSLRMCEPYT